jgi:uncharacterized protein
MNIPSVEEKNAKLSKAVLAAVILLSVFLLAETVQSLKETSVLGQGDYPETSITFTGTGEVSAVADVATFNFTVTKEAKTVKEAQELVEEVINGAVDVLDDADVDEKDIKTERYSVQPQYDWVTKNGFRNSERVFKGYQVSQFTSVKVREIDNSGDLLGKIGELGITNIGSLSFEIDDPDELKREARQLAIEEAKDKAKELADDLGVDLVRIVSFHENENGYYPQPMYAKVESMAVSSDSSVEPTLSVGEEEIKVSVSITYEIR